jgi:hypothetical protein
MAYYFQFGKWPVYGHYYTWKLLRCMAILFY